MIGAAIPGSLSPVELSPDIPLLVRDKSGQPAINPDKGFAKWFFLRALGANNSASATLAAGGQAVLNITAPAEENLRGDYEIAYLMASSTGRFSTQLFQSTINRNFQNVAIPNNLMYGSATFPGELPESIYLSATTGLQITVTDLSGASNTVSIVAAGRRFLDWGNERLGDVRRRDFYARRTHVFWLTDNRGSERSVSGNGTDTLVMNVPNDADFLCHGILDDSDGAYTAQIFEGLSSRAIMDAQVSRLFFAGQSLSVTGFPSTGGSAGLPAWSSGGRLRRWTHLFKRSSQINIPVTDTSGGTNKIRLALVGQLVYYNAPSGEMLTLPSQYSDRGNMQPAPLQGYGAQNGPSIPLPAQFLPPLRQPSGSGYFQFGS